MKIHPIFLGFLLVLSACGGESEKSANTGNDKASSPANSKLSAYMSESKICDVLPVEKLQSLFNPETEVKKNASGFRDTFSCSYTWARPDAAEREKNLVNSMVASIKKGGPKLTLRDRMLEYEVRISLKKSQRSADSFVPIKLSEEQIAQQVKSAKKLADERLTDEQKAVAGDATNSMLERMLRKSNENEEISGIGDAAFWSKLSTGSLEVLDGNVRITIAPVIANTNEEGMTNATRIATALLE